MPRYFFHVCNGTGFVPDEEGKELPNEAAARAVAIDSARSILSHEMREGELNIASFIEVQDDKGEYLFTLNFEDAYVVTKHH